MEVQDASAARQNQAAVRATCRRLRDQVWRRARCLRLGQQPDEAVAHVAAHAARWSTVERLELSGSPAPELLEGLIASLAESCPNIAAISLQLPPSQIERTVAACASASALGRLPRLSTMSLRCPEAYEGSGPGPALQALRQLQRVTSLSLAVALDNAGAAHGGEDSAADDAAWLPPRLRHLAVWGPWAPGVGGVAPGPGWMRAAAAAGDSLESLELMWLGLGDVEGADQASLHATLMQLTALTSLSGVIHTFWPESPGFGLRLSADVLLKHMPRLRRAALYVHMPQGTRDLADELFPALEGDWGDLDATAGAAANLESLAMVFHPPPSGAPRSPPALPRLRELHLVAFEADALPAVGSWAPALSAVTHLILGAAKSDEPIMLPPLGALAALPRLQRLALAAGEWGAAVAGARAPADADAAGAPLLDFSGLRGCGRLAELTLHDLAVTYPDDHATDPVMYVPVDDLAAAPREAPALRRLDVRTGARACGWWVDAMHELEGRLQGAAQAAAPGRAPCAFSWQANRSAPTLLPPDVMAALDKEVIRWELPPEAAE